MDVSLQTVQFNAIQKSSINKFSHLVPGQPPGLNAKALDAKRIALTWEKPLFSVPISGYVISYNTTDDVREITLTSPHEKHTVTALNPDTPYSFR